MTFQDVIAKWPNAGVLAADISGNSAEQVKRGTVKQWRRRNSIPSEYWLTVEKAARRRGIDGITVFTLAEIASQERSDAARQLA